MAFWNPFARISACFCLVSPPPELVFILSLRFVFFYFFFSVCLRERQSQAEAAAKKSEIHVYKNLKPVLGVHSLRLPSSNFDSRFNEIKKKVFIPQPGPRRRRKKFSPSSSHRLDSNMLCL